MGKTRTSPTGRRCAGGFTLIELLVVLAILVCLTAAFPLAWERLSPQRQVQVYAFRVAADLRLLRAQAMQENVATELQIDAASHAYRLAPRGEVRELPAAMAIKLAPALAGAAQGPVRLRFYPDGSSSGGKVILQRDGRGALLSVSPMSGRVTTS